ncbi:MAG: hypothetical protein ACKV2Q_08480 [Planctomycetaceae bacterium]
MNPATAPIPPTAPLPTDSVWARWPWLRRAVSVALIGHLLALLIAPLAVAPTSPLWHQAWLTFRPYLEGMNLNYGNHFFAPEPGPSHLVRYELHFEDGRIEQGLFPNVQQQQPRLRYHRHFMLSEFLNNLAIDDSRRELFDAVTRSYADHLRHEHHAAEVTLTLRRHYVPSPEHVLSGKRLNDRSLFAERPLGTHGFH